jgi:hypothetical protein
MSEPVVFRVRYSRDLCLTSAWRYWQRRLGKRYFLELIIGSGLYVLAVQGPYRWIEVLLMVAVGIFAFLGASIFFVHWYRALQGLASLDPPESTWTLSDDFVAQKSSLGESAIAWQAVREVWRFPDVWLLIWAPDTFSTLPVAQLPRLAREMIERRVAAAGGRVR